MAASILVMATFGATDTQAKFTELYVIMYIRWKKSRAITLNAPFYWILNPFFNIREKVEICQELNGESGKF